MALVAPVELQAAQSGERPADTKGREEARSMNLIIDVHTHPILPTWEGAYDRAGLKRRDGRPVEETMLLPVWTPEASLAVMDEHGVQAMMLSFPTGSHIVKGAVGQALARAMNEEMAAIVRRFPARFGAFAVLPLDDVDAAVREVDYALDVLGLDGVGLPTNVDGVYLGDERFAPLFEACNRHKAPVFVHPVAPAFFDQVNLPYRAPVLEYMFDSTRMIVSMVYSGMRARFSDFPMISTHAGGATPYLAGRLGAIASTVGIGEGRTMTSDEVMAGLKSFHYDVTASTTPVTLASLLQLVPSSQLLMGTDFPIRPVRYVPLSIRQIAESPILSESAREDIFNRTALGLFPRLARAITDAGVRS